LGLAPFFGAEPKLGPSFAELLLTLKVILQKKNSNTNLNPSLCSIFFWLLSYFGIANNSITLENLNANSNSLEFPKEGRTWAQLEIMV